MDIGQNDQSFYFESDHLALKGNTDYQNTLRYITCLERQRTLLISQIEDILLLKKYYMDNPDQLLHKIQNNEKILEDWVHLTKKIPEMDFKEILKKYFTKSSELQLPCLENVYKVRGRLADDTKPETFNQLWTKEEQLKLEELLLEYPPEEKEMRRFTKIAHVLGNRTPLQVASRVQKYFQKLHEAGLPIPGRIPKNTRPKISSRLKQQRKTTTFFPLLNIPIHINEEDFSERLSDKLESCPSKPDSNQVYVECNKLKVFILQKIRGEKEMVIPMLATKEAHCEICKTELVSRLHWSCLTCYLKINYCSDCFVEQLESNQFKHIYHNVVLEDPK